MSDSQLVRQLYISFSITCRVLENFDTARH